MNVFQTADGFIEKVFAFPCPVEPARDRNFTVFDRNTAVRVIDREGDFRVGKGFSDFGTVEDHVLHGGAAQEFSASFPEDPANGVGNVTFSATVRADNASHAFIEKYLCFVGKRFETNDLEFFKTHNRFFFAV